MGLVLKILDGGKIITDIFSSNSRNGFVPWFGFQVLLECKMFTIKMLLRGVIATLIA